MWFGVITIIGIIAVTHGRVGSSLIEAAEMILGPQPNLAAIDFAGHEGLPQLHNKMISVIQSMENTEGIIVLTDLLGGSPYNVANLISRNNPSVYVVYGVNLPMVLEVLLSRMNSPIQELINKAISHGKNGIGSVAPANLLKKEVNKTYNHAEV